MLAAIAQGIGGLASDCVEAVKYIGEELMEMPKAIEKGYENGLIVDKEDQHVMPLVEEELTDSDEEPIYTMTREEAEEMENLKAENEVLKSIKTETAQEV